jgi:RNA polymerase sigma-70 factor (ECF subfamily)
LIEKKLIEDCKNGDLHNFRQVVEKTSPLVYSVAFRMLGDEDTARDIVQDTMVTVWQKLPKIRSAESFKKWVYRIAVNKCYDHIRKRKREPELRLTDQAWAIISNNISENAATELENQENAMIIGFLTESLSPKQKTVFVLSELEELSHDEIAEITGMYRSAVKANLYNARKKIEILLKKYL